MTDKQKTMLVKLIISRLCVKSTLTKRKTDHSDTFRIKMIGLIWKENHILIEFPPMVANARLRLQMDTLGCKLKGTVAQANFYRKKEEFRRRIYRSDRVFFSA